MTNKYFEYVNDSDPFDDEIEVYRGVDENLPADRGKVSCYLLPAHCCNMTKFSSSADTVYLYSQHF